MPARYVQLYVKRNKSDAADAEAICEAVTWPTMRFVSIKTVEQQSVLMVRKRLTRVALDVSAFIVTASSCRAPGCRAG